MDGIIEHIQYNCFCNYQSQFETFKITINIIQTLLIHNYIHFALTTFDIIIFNQLV